MELRQHGGPEYQRGMWFSFLGFLPQPSGFLPSERLGEESKGPSWNQVPLKQKYKDRQLALPFSGGPSCLIYLQKNHGIRPTLG